MTKRAETGTQRARSPHDKRPGPFALLATAAILILTSIVVWRWTRREAPSAVPGACRGCNVLLITIDTLRVDRVGALGGRGQLTPAIDRLAQEGLSFTRAYASAPLTLPSHTSIMTAVPPPVHGVRNNSLFRLGDKLPTLATVLKSAGYRTGAFVGAFVLDARFGLDRGFDVYDDRYGEKVAGDPADGAERRAEDVVRPAAAWILQGSGLGPQGSGTVRPQAPAPSPWFAWVHLYDPHEPYRAPEPYASQHEPYDAEVAYTDAMVGRLLADLRAAGRLDHTLVMIAADHGESLGEHGERTHGVFVYDATMRVPWIIWAGGADSSGLRAGSSSDALVRLVDLAPTALDLVGVGVPTEFEGRSIASTDDRNAYLEAMDANLTRNWAPLNGIATRGYKLIDLPIPELYDLDADPHETVNLFTRQPERARTLASLLRGMTTAFTTRGTGAQAATLDAEARQRLQALGYVTSAVSPGPRTFTDADDPKTLIGPAEDLNRALAAFNAGSREAGMKAVREIMGVHPSFTTAAGIYASMQRTTGDLPGAVATLEDLVRRDIADQSVMLVLAGYLQELGAFDRSAGLLGAIIAAHPDYAEAYNSLGVVMSRQGRHRDARAAYRKVIELDPSSAKAYENLGVDEFRAGELEAAAADLARALSLDPQLPGAHNALAAVAMRQGRSSDAIASWKTALLFEPGLFDALYNLGVTLDDAGRRDEAQPYLERFIREAPPARYRADIARLRQRLARQ
jgi:arylsulfatase A-like enzyme/Tfp pilus assembly protein PilF